MMMRIMQNLYTSDWRLKTEALVENLPLVTICSPHILCELLGIRWDVVVGNRRLPIRPLVPPWYEAILLWLEWLQIVCAKKARRN
jgi:hypothetical protein